MTIQISTLEMARAYLLEVEKGTNANPLPIEGSHFIELESKDENLKPILENLRDDLDKILASASNMPKDFDGAARVAVHKNLSNLSMGTLYNVDFWRYLSAVQFNDVVRKRHPKSGKSKPKVGQFDSNWNNYGALTQSVRESLFHRLYTGASLALDVDNPSDPYHLCRIHDVDLWQSHIIRVLTGENRLYVKQLLLWFKNRDKWYVDNGFDFVVSDNDFKKDHLRDFVKRVRRLRSNIMHETFDASEIVSLIDAEAKSSFHILKR